MPAPTIDITTPPAPPSVSRATSIAITNQKGGVGKTTTAVNLAVSLAGYFNKSVLLVDFDPQTHASIGLGIRPGQSGELPFSEVLSRLAGPSGGPVPDVSACVVTTRVPNLSLIPGDRRLPVALPVHRPDTLAKALENLATKPDFTIIDTPPGLNIITTNALFAAHWALVPCQLGIYSLEGLADLLEMVDEFANIRRDVDPKKFCRILLTMVDARLKRSTEYVTKELEPYQDRLLQTKIRRNDALNQAQAAGLSIFHFDPSSYGAEDYYALTSEVLQYEEARTAPQPLVG
jgi:chromosome partitioning protein